MLQAIANIERYLGRGRQAFENDELLQVWMLHQLQVLGEAARVLPPEVRDLAPAIPWPKIAGMRNILVHGYFDIDTEIVWEAADREIPALKTLLEVLLDTLDS